MKKTSNNKGKGAPPKPLNKTQQDLVANHIPFAMNMGKKYAEIGRLKDIPLEDLQQEACIGLCIAAQKYDSAKGAEFQTYAHNWCKKYIMMAINNEKAPLLFPEVEEIEEADIIDDYDEQPSAEERILKVETLMAVLNNQEKKVVCMIYGINTSIHSFKEVAQKMKLQTARVHQIYEKSLTKMEWAAPL